MALPILAWFAISAAAKAAIDYFGQRGANKANERATDVQAQGNAAILKQEQDNETRRRYEWDEQQKTLARNTQIEEEARMEDLRRLEERELQDEPQRVAREATYRAYMKKYWGIDVAPTVPRTSRNIVSGGTSVTAPATTSALSQQAAPGAAYTYPSTTIPFQPQTAQPYTPPIPVSEEPPPRERLSENPDY